MNEDYLLEQVAKIVGAEVNGFCGNKPLYARGYEDIKGHVYVPWNPFINDSDIMDLIIALNLSIEVGIGETIVSFSRMSQFEKKYFSEYHGNNTKQAVRRAVIRAAAYAAQFV